MTEAKIPEGEFYSRLYVDPGAPINDSPRFRSRVAAFISHELPEHFGWKVGPAIEVETGHQFVGHQYYNSNLEHFFKTASLVDVFTAITLTWRVIVEQKMNPALREFWRMFIERAFKEENLKYRVDSKCGIHPLVDQEFDRNRVSVIGALADPRYAAVQHAVEAAFDQLNTVPMDGKGAARNIFEAAESLAKTITGSGSALTEPFVDRELRPLCDRLFSNDPQLKTTAGRLLSSFGKWVDAIHPYRHGHEREQPLVLPDDFAILAVSQGAGFIRWLVDVDRRRQAAGT
jgi:hypothetical protein